MAEVRALPVHRISRESTAPSRQDTPFYSPPELVVLDRPKRLAGLRSRLAPVVLAVAVFGALTAVIVGRAEMAAMNNRLQAVNQQIANATLRQSDLALSLSNLSSPQRIVTYAETRLHMVPAPSQSVVNGASVSGASSAASVPQPSMSAPYPAGSQVPPVAGPAKG